MAHRSHRKMYRQKRRMCLSQNQYSRRGWVRAERKYLVLLDQTSVQIYKVE
jgi:hypothetical protein